MTEPVEFNPRKGIYALTATERWELAKALMARPDRIRDGQAALRAKYPRAPDAMIHTATFHVYVDGVPAVVDFLAEAELAIREPGHVIGSGAASELLYHVYNWLQFRALLPDGRADLLDLVRQMRQAVEEDDREFIRATLKELEDVVDGTRDLPDVDP